MKTKNYSSRWFEKLRTTAKASQYIHSIEELQPGQQVVAYGRVSSRSQKDNLPPQLARLTASVKKRGIQPIATFSDIISGREPQRIGFERAILVAKSAGVPVVSEALNRFIRPHFRNFKKPKEYLPLSVSEMDDLMTEADGVRLATLLHPDTPEHVVRSYQTRRGQSGKGNYGGRPPQKHPKKTRRLTKKPMALTLRRFGLSYGEISQQLDIARSTVRDWIKKPHSQIKAAKTNLSL